MKIGELYSIDLNPIGHERIDLVLIKNVIKDLVQPRVYPDPVMEQDIIDLQIIASTIPLHKISGYYERIPPIPIFGNNGELRNFHYQLSLSSIKKCPVKKIKEKDLPLWIGSPYQSTFFENFLKRIPIPKRIKEEKILTKDWFSLSLPLEHKWRIL